MRTVGLGDIGEEVVIAVVVAVWTESEDALALGKADIRHTSRKAEGQCGIDIRRVSKQAAAGRGAHHCTVRICVPKVGEPGRSHSPRAVEGKVSAGRIGART